MLTVGYIKCYLPTRPGNARNTEGCFIRLKDGTILYAYSRYTDSSADDSTADIGVVRSTDEGETWSQPEVLLAHEGGENLMCPTLMWMENGDLGLFYLYRPTPEAGKPHDGNVRFVRSADEGKTWSEPIVITDPNLNVVVENGHVVRLKSGRILVPIAIHSSSVYPTGVVTFMMSDDDGRTWYEAPNRVYGPTPEWSASGLQEPMAYETEDGVIRTFSRTDLGCQYECDSEDDGITWSEAMPNRHFTSPCSPMMMKRVGKYTIVLINPIPRYITAEYGVIDDRCPLLCMMSEDDGKTFPYRQVLDTRGHVCYPDLFDGGDYFLVGYQQLDDGMIRKVYIQDMLQ